MTASSAHIRAAALRTVSWSAGTAATAYCLISDDAHEMIWRELRRSVKVAEGVTARTWLRV